MKIIDIINHQVKINNEHCYTISEKHVSIYQEKIRIKDFVHIQLTKWGFRSAQIIPHHL